MLHIKTSFDSLPNFDECEQTLVGNDFDVYTKSCISLMTLNYIIHTKTSFPNFEVIMNANRLVNAFESSLFTTYVYVHIRTTCT